MPVLTIPYRDDAERLALEQAIAYVTELQQAADTAPAGTVLAVCEQLALTHGRTLLRDTLAAALQRRITTAEQKGGPRGSARTRIPAAAKATTPVPCSPQSVP
jgi:hypothetical protein